MTKIYNYVLLALLVLSVFLALPISDALMFDTKKLLLFVVGFLVTGVTAFRLWKSKSVMITLSPFCLALAMLAFSALVSSFFTSPYPYEALFGWGGVLLMVTIVAGFSHELLTKKDAATLPAVVATTGAALAIVSGLQAFGYGPSQLYNSVLGTSFPHTAVFNLTESTAVALQVLLVAAAGLAALFFEKKSRSTHPVFMAAAVIVALGIGLMSWASFINPETKSSGNLPLSTNLQVVKGVLSSPKSALIGVGPNNFAHAYNMYKPAGVNQTPVWNVEFSSGVNAPLTFVATLGLLGLVSWALLAFFLIKYLLKNKTARMEPLSVMVAMAVLLQFVFPPSILMMTMFGVLLAYWLAAQSGSFEKVKMHTLITRLSPDHSKAASVSITHIISLGASVLLALFVVSGVYASTRAFAAAFLFNQSSMVLAKQGSASDIYDLQRRAVGINPYIDINRRRYGLTNLAVAQALAAKTDLTDQEREQVLSLVQQAIREGRAATMIEPSDARNWETMGTIYQNLIGVATGADQWTVSSYTRAIETDPANPTLWFQLGSIFYQNQQFSEASRVFAQAVQLKPDYLNAYYNLANTLKMNNQLDESIQAYQALLSRVEPGSAEYTLVQSELTAVQAQKTSQPQQPTTPSDDASVIDQSLSTPEETVPSNNTDLNPEAKEYLNATPVVE